MSTNESKEVTFEDIDEITVAKFTCKEISHLETVDSLLAVFKTKIQSPGCKYLLIDIGNVEFVSTIAINLLLVILKRIRMKGGEVALCCLTSSVKQVFELMQLSKLFDIYADREQAIAALKKAVKSE